MFIRPLQIATATLLALGNAHAQSAPHLVLITLDTTRADALSCYGHIPGASNTDIVTPNIDRLANEGIRFDNFFANAPSTLSSHATMMTGLDPHEHAIARNGFPLEPHHDTLAERLRAAGYDTIATIGSLALEQTMGLDQGFDIYDDAVSELLGIMYQDRAERVVDRALAHVDERTGENPLFLFVHFYDPHTPYFAPEPFAEKFTDPAYTGPFRDPTSPVRDHARSIKDQTADPAHTAFINGRYLGEVAYMDHHIGRLLDGLEERQILEHALVVLVADHGENLDDYPAMAWSHGSDVGHGVMRVPLILRGYGLPIAQHQVVHRQASMPSLAPTLERALGLDATLTHNAPDLWNFIRPGPVWDEDGWPERPTRPAYLEATRPRSREPQNDWNNLVFFRGVWAGGWGIYGAPVYHLDFRAYKASPPVEDAILPVLVDELAQWDATAPPHRDADMAPATQRVLKALGYLE